MITPAQRMLKSAILGAIWNEQSIRQCIADVTIVEMRESGMSFPIIAEKMGSDAASVYGVYKRAKRAKT